MWNLLWSMLTSHQPLSRVSDTVFFFLLYGTTAYLHRPRHRRKLFFAEYILSFLFGFGLLLFWETLPVERITHQLLYSANFILCGTVFSCLFLSGNLLAKLEDVIFLSAVYFQLLLIDGGATPVLSCYFNRWIQRLFLLLILLGICIFQIKTQVEHNTRPYSFCCLAQITVSLFSILISLINNVFIPNAETSSNYVHILNGAVCLLFNVLVFYLQRRLVKSYEDQARQQILLTHLEKDYQRSTELEEMLQETANLRHDIHNHMLILTDLLEHNQNEQAIRYLESFHESSVTFVSEIKTGNCIADVVLSQQAANAKQKGIDFFVDALIPDPPVMSDTEFSSLLFNIMDNAVDNCLPVKDARVEVYIRPKKNYLKIRVKNTADMESLKNNPDLNTSKTNPQIHGIGLILIRHLINKYDGMMDIQIADRYFTINCMIKTKAE